ncbi:MAG: hypothetical protein CEE38_17140 [Planctomycetes bacterium B3_Pla]|nr:MAG: hypothetical protein CEE38_17140 [Planctomycetes bacterium B3_Pla]
MRPVIIILLVVSAVAVGYFIGFYVRVGAPWSEGATIFMMITVAGAFGGLLYTARDSGLEVPHRDPDKNHVINLGWVADCCYGIAGAYVVFLILPTELTIAGTPSKSLLSSGSVLGLVKLLAMALVGGYGGRSLVDRALANIAKDAEEAKKSAEEAKKSAEEAKKKVVQIEVFDTKAIKLVNRHLDKSEKVKNVKELKEAVKVASRAARFEIFKETREVRTANWDWKKNKDVSLMERTIPIFEALIDNNAREQFHRNHGQLGYALKDQGGKDETKKDWERAYREISKAINLRDREEEKGFLMYEFNRAMCGIKIGKTFDSIAGDIRSAARRSSLHTKIKKNDIIVNWAKQNNYNLDTLQK